MLDVRRLRVLREVAAKGSFSAAAESLAYTQSAVSQQIAALEREAGTSLVDRGPRGVRLTDAGRALVAHTDVILARLADAEAELEAISGLRAGRLRVVAFASAAASIIPPAIARFRSCHPDVELTLLPGEPDDGMELLRSGEVDIALGVEAEGLCDTLTAPAGVATEALLDDHMYAVLPSGHRLAGRERIRVADLAGEPWIVGAATTSCPDARILTQACAAAGFEPQVAFQSDDYQAIQGFIAAGVGVSLIPELALKTVREDVAVLPLAGRVTPFRRIVAWRLAECWEAPARTRMIEILREVGEEFAGRRGELQLVS
jgi:DNA-binding transcriptional LysR family regulator